MKTWKDECGVFGIFNHPDAARLTYLGLYAIQHRGQESCGIVTLNNGEHIHHKGLGLVGEVFPDSELNRLVGHASVGHVRYSTTGQNLLTNAQPLTADLFNGPVAVAHNGNIVNNDELRKKLKERGSIFQGTNDTEILLHLLSHNPSNDIIEALKCEIVKIKGAFSLLLMTKDKLIAVRDEFGFRPLVIGKIYNEDGHWSRVIASETCAFDLIGAEFEREIAPGEIFCVDDFGETSIQYAKPKRSAFCIFEHIYFSRPDSIVFAQSVYENRRRFGIRLAQESAVEADLVIPIPDSGVPAALGYSSESKLPFEMGIIRNHYVGRTFIQPQQSIRDFGVKIKLNPQSAVLKNKRVVVVDDSLVRGTTSKKIINLIRQAGAKEVHMRIASPPTISPCFYGVDTPQKSQLIAASQSVEKIGQFIGADTLAYLSIDGLFKIIERERKNYCSACFDEKYPVEN